MLAYLLIFYCAMSSIGAFITLAGNDKERVTGLIGVLVFTFLAGHIAARIEE